MSLFEKVQKLNAECHKQLLEFYEQSDIKFPIEVRNVLAQIIECAVCGEGVPDSLELGLDPDNPGHLGQISEFLRGLVSSLESRLAGEEDPFFIKHKLTDALNDLKERSSVDPVGLFRRIRNCIQFEIELVKSQEVGSMQEADIVMDNLNFVRKRVEAANELLKRMVAEQDAFEIHLTEKQTLEDNLKTVQMQVQNEQTQSYVGNLRDAITLKTAELEQNLQQMLNLKNEFFLLAQQNIKDISDLQANIFQEKLFMWKFQQQKMANGLPPTVIISLDKLQLYCEQLADHVWRSRQQLQDVERLQSRNAVFGSNGSVGGMVNAGAGVPDVRMLLDDLVRLLTNLLNEAFIVEEQPPQVLKKGTKFTPAPKVSLLLGNLNIQMASPQVTTSIIREANARTLSFTDNVEVAGSITNGSATFEFNPTIRRLSAKFSSIQLKDIKRADRRGSGGGGSESVMEEKLCLLFESNVIVGDMRLRVRTLSLPVVVTSHGSQDPTAVATIMWDNAFGQMGRVPFQVPSTVPWLELAEVISAKFLTLTGRGLNEEQLRCLKQKAFKCGSHSENISWSEFCKDNLPDRNFSFWDWVSAALRTIEKKETHLKDVWKDGLLMGFIERQAAENLLSFREPGTFILRFSDSSPGAITISFVNEDRTVFSVNPMTITDLMANRLANQIKNLENLRFIYPGTNKDEAFGKYYTATTAAVKSYLPILPRLGVGPGAGGNMSQPSTPMSNFGCESPLQQISYPEFHQQMQLPQQLSFMPNMTTLDPSMGLQSQSPYPSAGGVSPIPSYNIPNLSALTPSTIGSNSNGSFASPLSSPDQQQPNPNAFLDLQNLDNLDEFMSELSNEHEDLIQLPQQGQMVWQTDMPPVTL